MRQNLSFGFQSKPDLKHSPQLQTIVRLLKFRLKQVQILCFQLANNEGADQSVWMRRLVCTCVVRKPQKTGFLALRPIYYLVLMQNRQINFCITKQVSKTKPHKQWQLYLFNYFFTSHQQYFSYKGMVFPWLNQY